MLGKWWNTWIIEYCLKPRLASAQVIIQLPLHHTFWCFLSLKFRCPVVDSLLVASRHLSFQRNLWHLIWQRRRAHCTVLSIFHFGSLVEFIILNIQSDRYWLQYYFIFREFQVQVPVLCTATLNAALCSSSQSPRKMSG